MTGSPARRATRHLRSAAHPGPQHQAADDWSLDRPGQQEAPVNGPAERGGGAGPRPGREDRLDREVLPRSRLAGSGRGASAAVPGRRGGVLGSREPRAGPAAELTAPAGCQRGLPLQGQEPRPRARPRPPVLQARAAHEKRRLADHRRATARTGGNATPGTSQVHERYTGLP